jgi:hypothetical protein
MNKGVFVDLAEQNDIGPDAAVQHFPVPDLPPSPVIESIRRSVVLNWPMT